MAIVSLLAIPLAAKADNVVQSFNIKGNVKIGDIVALSGAPNTVELVPGNRADLIYGVMVDGSKAPIVLQTKTQKDYVATGGVFPVLVSTENGAINNGDPISMSGQDGIGAKATGNQSTILGYAGANFDGSQNATGQSGKFKIGQINVDISVMRNPDFKNTLAIPGPLQKLGNSIAGREVSPLKVYIALIIFLTAMSLSLVLLIVGIRSGLVAIGRNPLSQHAIIHGIVEVIIVALIIFITSLAAVYLLLRI